MQNGVSKRADCGPWVDMFRPWRQFGEHISKAGSPLDVIWGKRRYEVQCCTWKSCISLGKGPGGTWIIIESSGDKSDREHGVFCGCTDAGFGVAAFWSSPGFGSRRKLSWHWDALDVLFSLFLALKPTNSLPPGKASVVEGMLDRILSGAGFWVLLTAWLMDLCTGFCRPSPGIISSNISVWIS